MKRKINKEKNIYGQVGVRLLGGDVCPFEGGVRTFTQ